MTVGLAPFVSLALAVALLSTPARAGGPLICHPFEIADAASLPWASGDGWRTPDLGYDVDRLTRDTLGLLTSSTPTLVRMETLRRAAIYAFGDRSAARQLLNRLLDRVRAAKAADRSDHRPWFDAGYFAATMQQLGLHGSKSAAVAADVDAYGLIEKSLELSNGDPTIEFAAALVTAAERGRNDAYARHTERALAGVDPDTLLARNIDHLN